MLGILIIFLAIDLILNENITMRLFSPNGDYAEEGQKIDVEFGKICEEYIKKYHDVDIRDLEYIMMSAVKYSALKIRAQKRKVK